MHFFIRPFPVLVFPYCTTGRWPGGGVSGERSGDQSGGGAAADLTRRTTESRHLQSHSQYQTVFYVHVCEHFWICMGILA